jgi:predicted nucleotidyltransferase
LKHLSGIVTVAMAFARPAMTRDEVLATLRANEATLRERGVLHTAVFGSVARGAARPDSDIDILVELDPARSIDIYGYVAIKQLIATLLPGRVDVVDAAALRPRVSRGARRDAAYAF